MLPETRKKILIILGFLAITALLGFLLYLAFFRRPMPELPPEEPFEIPVGLPEVGPAGEREQVGEEVTGLPTEVPTEEIPEEEVDEIAAGEVTRVTALSTDRADSATLMSDGSLAYYNRAKSKFYKVDPTGRVVELSDKEFYSVENVNWSPAGNRAVLEYPDNRKITYDFDTQKQYTLPSEWEDFDFNSSGNQIALKHMAIDKENRWLATANYDGTGMYLVEPLGINADKVQVNWSPTGQVVANYWESMDAIRQEVFFVGLYGENFKSTIVEGRSFKGEWTSDGEQLLYSVYDAREGYLPRLWIVNASGEAIGTNRRDLGVNTWIDKCTISPDNNYAYCAVPTSMPEGAGLYPELTYDIPDDFYRINLSTGFKEILAKPYGDYTADQVMLSPDEDKLYFRDINTGQLYEIKLR